MDWIGRYKVWLKENFIIIPIYFERIIITLFARYTKISFIA